MQSDNNTKSSASRGLPPGWGEKVLPALAVPLFLLMASIAPKVRAAEMPVIKGELGPCSADFTVTDSEDEPLYNAKIHVTIRYGFLSKRKAELEIGTDSDGKARIEGLPSKVKRPLEIKVSHGEDAKVVAHDPSVECQANLSVTLGEQ